MQDVAIVFVTVSGRNKGQLVQETYANKIYSRDVDGWTLSAIQITTAAAICTVLDLLVRCQTAAEWLHPSGGYSAKGFPGEPLRSGLHQAGNQRSA